MEVDWTAIANPFLDRCPQVYARDPLLHYHDGVFRCFHTSVEKYGDNFRLFLDVVRSVDLVHWSASTRLTTSELGFSSSGNIIGVEGAWVMCVQSYPIPIGREFADESARLWLMFSLDLENWSDPRPIKPEGVRVIWTESHRQIDPCLIEHDDCGRWLMAFHGERPGPHAAALGIAWSEDLEHWVLPGGG